MFKKDLSLTLFANSNNTLESIIKIIFNVPNALYTHPADNNN